MGIGVVSLTTSQKREQSGPPFAAGSADNGVSVDAVSGRIVLGNDASDPLAPAALLSIREILTGLFSLILRRSAGGGATTTMNGLSIVIAGGAGTLPAVTVTATSGQASINVQTAADAFSIRPDGSGHIDFRIQNLIDVWTINTTTGNTQMGSTFVADNGALLQLNGTLTNRVLVSGVGAGTTTIDRNLDTGKLFLTSAANNLALPDMTGSNTRLGFRLRYTIGTTAGGTITASAGQTIRFGSLATSSGGTLSSTDVGAYISIILINASTWVTETFNGAWVIT
jgi:hypothetical protein